MEKKSLKIVVIGGGSSYTPELMEGFIDSQESLPIKEIWLVDIKECQNKLEINGELSKRMWKSKDFDVDIYTTFNRKEVLKNADFVIIQLRVGQMEARIIDERIPLSYGMIGQETNGAGGILKAFRTIPVLLDIVADMKEYCPNAWLINFTNPSGIITETVIRYGKWNRVIGLCNLSYGIMKIETELLNQKLIHKFAGLNHFHWHKTYNEQGNDVTTQILHNMNQYAPANIHQIQLFNEQLIQMNMIPCSYHQYYDMQEDTLKHQLEEYQTIGTRGQQVREVEEKLFELYKDPNLKEKPKQLSQRGGAFYSKMACDLISSISNNTQTKMVVSTLNHGAIQDLPYDCVVEVSSIIDSTGANSLTFESFPYAQKGILQLMKNFELCVCEAGVTGNYGLALQAFQMNPLIPSGTNAKRVLDELLYSHQEYLPQFKDKIQQLHKEKIQIKDDFVNKLFPRK